MKKSDVLLKIANFTKALQRLQEAAAIAEDELDKDGVIQRFEFTIEMLWKALKAILAYQGVECYSPRNCIKEAFKANLIEDDEIILDMLDDRNASLHIYDQRKSQEIFERIQQIYIPYLTNLALTKKIGA